MLAVTTDMKAPKDVSVLSLTIKSGTQIKHNILARVRPDGDVELPATIAIAEPDDPNATIRVRVIIFQEQKPRVLRDVRTTIPRGGRTALLRLGLNFVDDGSGTGNIPADLMPGAVNGSDAEFDPYSAVVSKCDVDMTVIDGVCQSDFVDSESLPDFEEKLVFGQGGKEGCFQSATCFGTATPVAITPGASGPCSFPIAGRATNDLNLAFSTRETGECLADGRCLVPIDQGDLGWHVNGANIDLSPGTCAKLREGAQLLEGHAPSCTPKTEAQPLCEAGGTTKPTPIADAGPDAAADAGGGPEKIMPERFPTGVALLDSNLYVISEQGLAIVKPGMPGQGVPPIGPLPGPRFLTHANAGLAIAEVPIKPAVDPPGGGWVLPTSGGVWGRIDFPADTIAVNTVVHVGSPLATYLWGIVPSTGLGLYTSGISGNASPLLPALDANITSIVKVSSSEVILARDDGSLTDCTFAGEFMCAAVRPTANAARIDALALAPSPPQTALYLQADALWTAALSGPTIVATKLVSGVQVAPFPNGGSNFPHGLVVNGSCAFFTTNTSVEWAKVDSSGLKGTIAGAAGGVPLGLDVGEASDGKLYVYWALYAELATGGAYRAPVPAECLK